MTTNQNRCPEQTMVSLIDRLNEGIELPGGFIYAKSTEKGRLSEEQTLNLYLRQSSDENRIMRATIFMGRAEFFKPWIDLSQIQNRLILNSRTLVYFDSDLEMMLYRLLIESMSTGGKIYVEYDNDPETRNGLHAGVPAAATRIGYILFQNGITGFSEFSLAGEIKQKKRALQGAKAISSHARNRHLDAIESQMRTFLGANSGTGDPVIGRALKRAQRVLDAIAPNYGFESVRPGRGGICRL